jgi:hypothetical protein
MNPKMRIATLLMLIVLQIGIGSATAVRYATRHKAPIPEAPIRRAAGPSAAAAMRQTALTHARAWRPDASLIAEVSWLSWPTSGTPDQMAPVNGWATFVFASGGNRLAVVVDRGSGFVLGQHAKSLGLPALGSVDPASFSITAETASATAEILGGKDYREACSAHRNLSKVGAAFDSTTQEPIWAVTYADDRSSSNPDIIVLVNAMTGQVEQKTTSMPACDKS